MTMPLARRPGLTRDMEAEEFARWYWEKAELIAFARRLGLRSSGDKHTLTERIRATLAGEPFSESTAARRTHQLSGPLSPDTVIPRGQRCTQHLRAWFVAHDGGFRFDAAMRAFFAADDGDRTLADALAHWRSTRAGGPQQIDEQFEYNRFGRTWSAAHPEAGRGDLLTAWRTYRDTPLGERDRA